jgi:hypothetical protein
MEPELQSGYSHSRKVKRFPRLTMGKQAAAFAHLLWTPPEIQGRIRRKSPAMRFIFTVPIRSEFRASYGTAYRILFGHFDWEKAFEKAYRESSYGNKQMSAYISLGLRALFIQALKIWLAEPGQWGPEYEEFTSVALAEFGAGSRSKTGPPTNANFAVWAVQRLDRLGPQLADLRRDFKKQAHVASKKELVTAIETVAPWSTVKKALESILAEQKSIEPRQLFLSSRMSNQKVASAIVQVELLQKGCDFRSVSFRTYLRFGKDILQMLSDSPDTRPPERPQHR